jgi:hypothetical protein
MSTAESEVSSQVEAGKSKAKSPREVELVTMFDGRQVEFVGKRRMLKESFITDSGVSVRLDFRNGHTINFDLPNNLLYQFAAHGAEQKLGDETAGEDDVDDMVLDVEALIERLNKGEWKQQREAGGMSGTSVLLQALVEVTGKSVEQIKLFLQGDPSAGVKADGSPVKPALTNAEKLALRASPKLVDAVRRIEAAKAAKTAKVDTEALLGTLG